MRAALLLFGYALAVAWCLPLLLAPLTRAGARVRLGLAAWLAAMASMLASVALGIQFLLRTVAADWPSLTRVLCRSVAGGACTPVVYRSAAYELGVAALATGVSAAAAVALWRYGRRTQRARVRSRAHAEAAILAGRALPGTGAVVLDDPRPAAYCVAGRPAAIVLTSGALAVLDSPQLAAVLAHERAHLAHRHHLLATVTRGLSAALPGVPLFTRGTAEVACLAEMAADDAAARGSGRTTVVAALLAIGTGTAVPAAALTAPVAPRPPQRSIIPGIIAAAAYAVPARVERMLRPPRPAADADVGAALGVVLAVLVLVPSLLAALAGLLRLGLTLERSNGTFRRKMTRRHDRGSLLDRPDDGRGLHTLHARQRADLRGQELVERRLVAADHDGREVGRAGDGGRVGDLGELRERGAGGRQLRRRHRQPQPRR